MKKILLLGMILFSATYFASSLHADGGKKPIMCRTVDAEDNVLSYGNRCDFGWSQCIANSCPSPDGTRVEFQDEIPW